jgi:hydrogenase-1 operon protein HyaF
MSKPGPVAAVISRATDVSAPPASEFLQPIFWKPRALEVPTVIARPGDGAKAILSEIRDCVERLLAHGSASSIDLRFLKLMPEERATLEGILGRGEVSAVVDSVGRSEVIETAVPCVWWVRHFQGDGETIGECVEITDVPDLLLSDREAAASALEELCARIAPATRQEVHEGQSR